MKYVTRLGAYGLAVAAAFAVALAVLVSVSPTPTAEATVQTRTAGTFATLVGNANNGDTLYINNDATEYVQFEISTVGAASASFTHSSATDDGQQIVCDPGSVAGDCDADTGDSGVTVALKIDPDSGAGAIFIRQTLPGSPTTAAEVDTVSVEVAQVPTKLTAKLADKSVNSGQGAATAGTTTLEIRLLDEDNEGIAGETLTIVSTRALLSGASGRTKTVGADTVDLQAFSTTDAPGVLAGTVDTSADPTDNDDDGAGYAEVIVTGGGTPGISTITVTFGDLTATADLVLHGAVKSISADPEQGAIEVGGGTYIVVTALDSAGNPVADQNVSVKSRGITPPERLATPVEVIATQNKDVAPVGGTAAGTGDIPACGDGTRADDDTTDDVDESTWWGGTAGTNDDGQCVLRVDAPNPAGTANDAARGAHTIVIVASGTGASVTGVDDVEVVIDVGGAPTSIESDAPERIDPSAEVTIGVTVLDDENLRVGSVYVEVIKTDGPGAIIADAAAKTTDGRAKFTYLASSRPDVVEFLVRTYDKDPAAGGKVTAKLPIIIQIASEEVEEPPEPEEEAMPEGDATLTVQGSLGSFSGGSLDDFAAAAGDACPGGSQIAVQDAAGGWQLWSSTAPAFVNIGFTTAFADGFDGMTFVWVTSCESDAMEDPS